MLKNEMGDLGILRINGGFFAIISIWIVDRLGRLASMDLVCEDVRKERTEGMAGEIVYIKAERNVEVWRMMCCLKIWLRCIARTAMWRRR